MSYSKYYSGGWQDGSSGGTPITADALNHMEQGIIDSESISLTKSLTATTQQTRVSIITRMVTHPTSTVPKRDGA